MGALPLSLFCGGQTYFVQHLHETLGVQPLVVHTTYQFSQARGKRQRPREHGLWLLDDAAYYGGITNVAGESDAGSSGSPNTFGGTGIASAVRGDGRRGRSARAFDRRRVGSNRLDAAAWYRLAVRNLLAGRARDEPHRHPARNHLRVRPVLGKRPPGVRHRRRGRAAAVPGSCPQDHVFNLPNMERAGVSWREHSFLENENVKRHNPAILSSSGRVYLELFLKGGGAGTTRRRRAAASRAAGKKAADDETKPNAAARASAGRTVSLPAFPSDAELARAVGDADEGLLIVSSGIASFCGFENPETARAFDEQMRVALEAESHFCGAGAGGVGRCVRHRVRHSQGRRGGPRLRGHARERARPGGVQAEVREDRQAPGHAMRFPTRTTRCRTRNTTATSLRVFVFHFSRAALIGCRSGRSGSFGSSSELASNNKTWSGSREC